MSNSIAKKWSCDSEKMYSFIVEPVAGAVCKEKDKPATEGVGRLACEITMQTLVGLGVDEIVSKFGCDREKVAKDIKNSELVCNYVEAQSN